MIKTVFDTVDSVLDLTSLYGRFTYLGEEVGELATEIAILHGDSTKEPGEDGVVGEAIDVIACCLDIIHRVDPNLTEEDIKGIMLRKCDKWKQNVTKRKEKMYE